MGKITSAQELAEIRTGWADEWTRMAGERTFADWLRTGLALVAAGLATTRLIASVEPQWLVRIVGVISILLGGTLFYLGLRTYLEVTRDLKEEEIEATSVWFVGVLPVALIVAAALAPILVFI